MSGNVYDIIQSQAIIVKSDTYAGKMEYKNCLACGGALLEQIEYHPMVSTTIVKWTRYEYDGLDCLRIDEKCDDDWDGSIEENEVTWRVVEVNTHRSGNLGALIGKRVYQYADSADSTPDISDDFTYTYDALGNVVAVYNAEVTGRGNELYYFTQDAFGNELNNSSYTGTSWATARNSYGITEHQTGKWIDPFTGLYFFSARWYEPFVGRFVGRDQEQQIGSGIYTLSYNLPTNKVDPTGRCVGCSATGNWVSPIPEPPSPLPTPEPTPRPPKPFPECHQRLPWWSFWHHGNYCGNQVPPWRDLPINVIGDYLLRCPPIDAADECCMHHDLCYWINGDRFHSLCALKSETEMGCDQHLCNCVWNMSGAYVEGIQQLFCTCGCGGWAYPGLPIGY